MKKIVLNSSTEVNVKNISCGIVGIRFLGTKYLAAQVGAIKYQMFAFSEVVGLNRGSDDIHDGVNGLIQFYLERGGEAYLFDSLKEAQEWWTS